MIRSTKAWFVSFLAFQAISTASFMYCMFYWSLAEEYREISVMPWALSEPHLFGLLVISTPGAFLYLVPISPLYFLVTSADNLAVTVLGWSLGIFTLPLLSFLYAKLAAHFIKIKTAKP